MGFTVLERVEHGRVEFLLMTRWDNMDAIRAYAGHKAEHAVVEPEAQALLDRFDQHAKHYVVALEESR
jgi:heme-degrading monooxygenase HmoA